MRLWRSFTFCPLLKKVVIFFYLNDTAVIFYISCDDTIGHNLLQCTRHILFSLTGEHSLARRGKSTYLRLVIEVSYPGKIWMCNFPWKVQTILVSPCSIVEGHANHQSLTAMSKSITKLASFNILLQVTGSQKLIRSTLRYPVSRVMKSHYMDKKPFSKL